MNFVLLYSAILKTEFDYLLIILCFLRACVGGRSVRG